MTPQEAIEQLNSLIFIEQKMTIPSTMSEIEHPKSIEALKMAISAIKKQTSEKPIDIGPLTEPVKIGRGIFGKGTTILQKCPVCSSLVNSVRRVKFCEECGQALNWDKEEKDKQRKRIKVPDITQGTGSEPDDGELELINAYTRRALTADEVYVFSVVLCDNDVDRDGERFTVESLFELEKLFVGKVGIIDHNPSAKKQTARIFACRVESVDGRKTATGDDYFKLIARAYLPRCEKNSGIILALDSGIIKEISVGCAVDSVRCSICGEDIGSCPHKKGEIYSSKLCCGELTKPYDAYEWSFVATPSQTRQS